MKVGKEKRDGAPTPPPSQDMIPDMSSANYYVGGLPPDVKLKVNVPGPFLGCMKDLQIDQGEYSLLKGQNWGIQASCSKKVSLIHIIEVGWVVLIKMEYTRDHGG